MRVLKNAKGITLIALVVTIIVLMILAGVAVAALMGNNGLITRAGEAKESQRGAAVLDEVKLAINENKMIDEINKTKGATGGLKTKGELVEELVGKGYLTADEKAELETVDEITIGSVRIDFSGLVGGTGGTGGGTGAGALTIALSIAGTAVNATTPPKPDNFYYVGGTIDSGYVISDNASDENKYASSTSVGTDLQGNQFVWVPVEKDQKITLNVTSPEDITSLKLYDPLGEEISLGSVSGKSYSNSNITPTINGGYKAEVTTASGTETKTLVVRSLYAKDTFSNDYLPDIYNEDYCLSDEVIDEWRAKTGNASSKQELYTRRGIADDAAWVTFLRNQAMPLSYTDGSTTHADSVRTNGGFYIARYEAGATTPRTSGSSSATVDSIKTANGVPTSKADQTPYNYITQSQALGLAQSMYPGATFTCTLLTGAAWDRTLGWLVNTNNKTLADVSTNSSDWGNYSNVSFAITRGKYSTNYGSSYTAVSGSYTKPASSVLLTTGAAPTRNVSNNIFDLTGNVYEWTTEVNGSYLVSRGGYCYNSGADNPSSFRINYSATSTYGNIGFRSALFL